MPVMPISIILCSVTRSLVLCLLVLTASPETTMATPYFDDGLLGLSQKELHEKLGRPQAVRDRKSALRIFTYYPISDWATYFSKLVSPENGEDVYTFTREGVEIRYSFSYTVDPNDADENRPLIVRLVDIEFPHPMPISRLPTLVPEFHPSTEPASPSFRSNIWVLLFQGTASPKARFIVKEPGKDQFDWTLCFQLFSLQGLPDRLTRDSLVDRVEISTQSVEFITRRLRHTHEPTLNPFSAQFEKQPMPPPRSLKTIPVPHYAE